MDDLQFQIVPPAVPLGRTTNARLIVLYSGKQALENLRGNVKSPASCSLLGLDTINILRVPAGEQISLPIRITGRQPGPVQIRLSRLTARSVTGAVHRFEDREIAIEVSSTIEMGSSDISLLVDPVGPLVQHRVSRVRCRLHNNFLLPLAAPQITVSAHDTECYLGREPDSLQMVLPGTFFEIEAQVLPGVAGVMNLSARADFSIQGQAFTRQQVQPLDVLPSREGAASIASQAPKVTKRILLVTAAPRRTPSLDSYPEIRDILFEMKFSALRREHFEVDFVPAATIDHFSKSIVYQPPYLIHFCGHGTERGIVLEGGNAEAREMSTASLAGLLKPLSGLVECVILNACKTLDSASELARHVPYVIGMRQVILDGAAVAFSRGFYQALGAGHTMERSFELGKARLLQDYFAEHLNPVLFDHGRAV